MKALFSVVIALIISFNEAHVRLDFPPAHLPNYDFLDNARTEGPCGTRGKLALATAHFQMQLA